MSPSPPLPFDPKSARARVFDIIKAKSFVRGKVVLTSGKESDHYFDMKPTMFDPEGADLLSKLILHEIESLNVDYVGGVEMGAVPLIGPIIVNSRDGQAPIPGFFVRKAAKGHGTRQRIEGVRDLKGKRVVVVEDVTTTGGSAMSAVEALREAGATVALLITILDRNEGATALYAGADIPFRPLFTSGEFLAS